MSKVAIIQSNYIPWKGYFHIIKQVDHFVFLDNVQYTQRDWRNRNLIKTPSGIIWLTVPNNGTQTMLIEDVIIDNSSLWYKDHLKTLICSYKRCRHFDFFFNFLENIYLGHNWKKQSELNQFLIREISQIMNINTEFHQADNFTLVKGKNEKIISIIKQLGGNHYLTGPAARSYIEPEMFRQHNITLEFMDYSGYPEYNQPWGSFVHQVSILDLLFCTGPEAPRYIWERS